MFLFFFLLFLFNLAKTNDKIIAKEKLSKDSNQKFTFSQPYFYYKSLGDEYRLLKYYDLAIINYEKAILINKKCIYCLYWKVVLYIEKEDYFNAYFTFSNLEKIIKRRTIRIPKKIYYNHFFLRIILNYKKSIDTLEKRKNIEDELDKIEKIFTTDLSKLSIQNDESKNLIFFFLGKIYFFRGIFFKHHSIEKIISYFNNAIYYNYKINESRFELYKLYNFIGQKEEADKILDLLRKDDPLEFFKIFSKHKK